MSVPSSQNVQHVNVELNCVVISKFYEANSAPYSQSTFTGLSFGEVLELIPVASEAAVDRNALFPPRRGAGVESRPAGVGETSRNQTDSARYQ